MGSRLLHGPAVDDSQHPQDEEYLPDFLEEVSWFGLCALFNSASTPAVMTRTHTPYPTPPPPPAVWPSKSCLSPSLVPISLLELEFQDPLSPSVWPS